MITSQAGTELQDYENWTAEEKLNVARAAERLGDYVTEGAGENLVLSAAYFENFMAPRPDLHAKMEDELAAVTRVLAKHQWPIRIHATYNESITRVLDTFERVFDETGYKARLCIDHAETISPENIVRIKRWRRRRGARSLGIHRRVLRRTLWQGRGGKRSAAAPAD